MNNPKAVAFFGHRTLTHLKQKVRKQLETTIRELIKNGYTNFMMGTYGEFDKLCLDVCREIRTDFPKINIIVVLCNLNYLKKNENIDFSRIDVFNDVKTIFYPVEDTFYKNKIIKTNQYIVNDSDLIVAYVDMTEPISGAKRAVKFAQKLNKPIINIFDKIE